MKSILGMLLLSLLFFQISAGQDFYDVETINTIEITFQESNWDQILDNLYAAGDEERLVGSAVINGEFFDSVGVRYKGNSSYNASNIKNPLNIKLDYIIEDQELDGYGTLKLGNVFKDPSFVREVLSYELARKYMPASQANYIKVTINGTYYGLYTSVQDVDKYFARMHDYDDDGVRFKGVTGGNIQDQDVVWGYWGTDSSDYFINYEIESDSGWSQLIDFLDVLNNDPVNVEDVLNVDRHLWMLAFDILLVNLDAPVNMAQNYYLFEDYSDKFNPIIWDLNESFGVFSHLVSGGPLSTSQLQQLSPLLNLTNSNYPIIKQILSDDTYQRMYFAHMRTMIAENFSNNWYETRAYELQDIIDAEVAADPYKFFTYSDFINNINSSIGFGPQTTIGITQLMSSRESYLSGLSYFTASPPTIANITNSPATVTAGSTVTITSDISNATSAILGWRQSVGSRFEKADMYDDGAHGDGAAGDGTYGAQITVSVGDVNYYIYAENANAGLFAPERAEYEYYEIEVTGGSVTGDLTINEFLASNSTTYADQNGEFDDWIEIYNSADSVISLNGYYLSDDLADIAQWVFPDTFIEADGYLLIWADEDDTQEGLHANFKISASGETLVLSAPDQTVLDQITFSAQTTDVSYGRYPDGADNWIEFVVPTPDASNTLAINNPPEFEWTLYAPNRPTSSEVVYVQTKVTDDNSLIQVNLKYDAGSGYITRTMYDDGNHHDSLAGDNIYGSSIPGYSNMIWVNFYIEAADDSSAVTLEPESMLFKYQIIDLPALDIQINEFMADNDTTIMDPDGSGGYPDWIELYNAGGSSVNLEGYYLTDDLTQPTMWLIPAGVTIDPGEYLLFWADNDEVQGIMHTNFKLSADGEYIGFFDTDANGNTAIDMISFSAQQPDLSMGRCPETSGDWQFLGIATPGYVNCVSGYICGDANGDSLVNVSDGVRVINYVFAGGDPPDPLISGDANCDGIVNVSDAVAIINYVFAGGYDPCDPNDDGEPDC